MCKWLKFCMSTQIANQTIRTGNQSLLGGAGSCHSSPTATSSRLISQDNLNELIRIYPAIVLEHHCGLCMDSS